MESIMQSKKECWMCHTTRGLHCHHVIHGTANRKLSEQYGLKVWLCREHHTGNGGVHHNVYFDEKLKEEAQKAFEQTHTRRDFLRIFGISYLDASEI